jgi:hypothetical protein
LFKKNREIERRIGEVPTERCFKQCLAGTKGDRVEGIEGKQYSFASKDCGVGREREGVTKSTEQFRQDSGWLLEQLDSFKKKFNSMQASSFSKLQELVKQLTPSQLLSLEQHSNYKANDFEQVYIDGQLASSEQFVVSQYNLLKHVLKTSNLP